MSKQTPDNDDFSLFQQEIAGVKKLPQDTIMPPTKPINKQNGTLPQNLAKRTFHQTQNNEFYFSDEFEPVLKSGAVRYCREDISAYELKRLRRGDYVPDVCLDLHGMTQAQAKRELAALITYCLQENIACASVMHGIGKHILKQRVPAWLAQHPQVLAFHQAPLEFGGQGALLLLFSLID